MQNTNFSVAHCLTSIRWQSMPCYEQQIATLRKAVCDYDKKNEDVLSHRGNGECTERRFDMDEQAEKDLKLSVCSNADIPNTKFHIESLTKKMEQLTLMMKKSKGTFQNLTAGGRESEGII